jgi:hypothetical protein
MDTKNTYLKIFSQGVTGKNGIQFFGDIDDSPQMKWELEEGHVADVLKGI